MPVLVLLLAALAAGLTAYAGARRIAPGRGATAAAAEAVEDVVESAATATSGRRRWVQARLDPAVATGLALTLALLLIVVGGLLLAALAYLVRGNGTLRDLDASVADWGQAHGSATTTRILTWITDLGDTPVVTLVGVTVAIVELVRRPSRWLIPFLLVVPLGAVLVTTVVKDLADRARPTLNPIAATLGPSFPSGHSSTAAAFYAALALVLSRGRPRRVRAILVGGAVGIAVAVAASRVLLDVHWLSDVVAGLTLGWIWFAICAIAFGGRLLRFGAPAEEVAEAAGTPPTISPLAPGGGSRS